MREGMRLAATHEGMFVSPESGAAVIATGNLRASGFLRQDDEVVIFSTGIGLKHTDLIEGEFPVVDPSDPNALDGIVPSA
jgi:threonine synthase